MLIAKGKLCMSTLLGTSGRAGAATWIVPADEDREPRIVPMCFTLYQLTNDDELEQSLRTSGSEDA